ncbi:MAG: caspase domain-containing protein [Pirellulales bacterium]
MSTTIRRQATNNIVRIVAASAALLGSSRHLLRTAAWLSAVLAIALAMGLPAAAQIPLPGDIGSGESGTRTWAMLVGVEDYEQCNDLRFVRNDVRRLEEVLSQRGGVGPAQILVLADDSRAGETKHPNKANIEDQLVRWLKLPLEDDQLILYFSGHGVRDPEGRLYLAPSDLDPERIEETGIALSRLHELLGGCKARVKLLILDACHAGSAKDPKAKEPPSALNEELAKPFEQANRVITLASSTGEEKSQIWSAREQSLFTYWLVQALKGHADTNENGRIDTDELYRYVYDNVTFIANEKLGGPQTPVRYVNGEVPGVPTVMETLPMSWRDRVPEIANELALAMQDHGLSRVAVLEFSSETLAGEELRRQFGSFGRLLADRLQSELVKRGRNRYSVLDRATLRGAIDEIGLDVTDLGSPDRMRDLADKVGGLPVLALGKFESRQGGTLSLRVRLKRLDQGDIVASAGGPTQLSVDDWAQLGRSVELVNEPPPPTIVSATPTSRVSLVSTKIERLDDLATDTHPFARQSKSPFRVRIMIKGPDGRYSEERHGVVQGNDYIVPFRKGEVFALEVEQNTGKRVLMRLLVDGLNTLPQKYELGTESDSADADPERLEAHTEVDPTVGDPNKGVVRVVVGERVALDEARPWVLDPAELKRKNKRFWRITGFAQKLGSLGETREFTVVDAKDSLAARREYTDQLGIITVAFYTAVPARRNTRGQLGVLPGQVRNEVIDIIDGPKMCGELLGLYTIKYVEAE